MKILLSSIILLSVLVCKAQPFVYGDTAWVPITIIGYNTEDEFLNHSGDPYLILPVDTPVPEGVFGIKLLKYLGGIPLYAIADKSEKIAYISPQTGIDRRKFERNIKIGELEYLPPRTKTFWSKVDFF